MISNFYNSIYFEIILYWIPVMICLLGYTYKTYQNYLLAIKRRDLSNGEFLTLLGEKIKVSNINYYKTDTYGMIVLRIVFSFTPGLNIVVIFFDHIPKILGKYFNAFIDFLDSPIVPRKE